MEAIHKKQVIDKKTDRKTILPDLIYLRLFFACLKKTISFVSAIPNNVNNYHKETSFVIRDIMAIQPTSITSATSPFLIWAVWRILFDNNAYVSGPKYIRRCSTILFLYDWLSTICLNFLPISSHFLWFLLKSLTYWTVLN